MQQSRTFIFTFSTEKNANLKVFVFHNFRESLAYWFKDKNNLLPINKNIFNIFKQNIQCEQNRLPRLGIKTLEAISKALIVISIEKIKK